MVVSRAEGGEWCEFCCAWTDEDVHRQRACPLFTTTDEDGLDGGGCTMGGTASAAVDKDESV